MAGRIYRAASLRLAAACLPALLIGQQPASDEIRVSSQPYVSQAPYLFRADAKLVDIGVAVRDGHGRAVPGLKPENFRISDDGKPREIAAFSENRAGSRAVVGIAAAAVTENPSPSAPPAPARFLAIFFDDVNGTYGEEAGDLTRAQAAATRFVKSSLPPGVQVGIFTASGTPSLSFTADAGKLLKTIGEVKIHPRFSEKVCSGINPYQAYRIAELKDKETLRIVVMAATQARCASSPNVILVESEAMWSRVKESSMGTLASIARVVNELGAKPGERVLVLTSTGFVGGSLEAQQDRIIDQAVHAGVVINSLVAKGLHNELMPGERFGDDEAPERAVFTVGTRYQAWAKADEAQMKQRPILMDEAMGNLAHGTGGILFHNNNDLNAGFREASVPPEVTYRLSFNPEGVVSDGSYHKLSVKLLHEAAYSVEARPGYFAQEEMADEEQRANLDKEVLGSDAAAGVAAGVALEVEKLSDSQRTVRVVAHVDISKLEFAQQSDRRRQHLTVVAAFFDAQGKMITAKEGKMDLALKPETYTRLAETGVNAELSFLVPPGVYKLRAVVQEAVKGGLAASTYPIDVR